MDSRNSYLSSIADNLKKGVSVNLVCNDKIYSDLIILSLFCFYELRVYVFNNLANSYIFINLSDINLNNTNIDEYLVRKVSKFLNVNFVSLVDISEYLKSMSLKLIIYFSSNDLQDIRCMFGYSFTFKDNCLFILHTSTKLDFINQSFNMSILDINTDSSNFIFRELNEVANVLDYSSDIYHLIQAINHVKLSSQESTFVNTDTKLTKKNKNTKNVASKNNFDFKKEFNFADWNFLTEREIMFFEKLNEKGFLSRDEMKNILWGNNSNITEDALDQFISRLRNKLIRNKIKRTILQTIKGKGIKINKF